MLFSSFAFLFWFLPVTLAGCLALPALCGRGVRSSAQRRTHVQNAVLLAAGVLFYAFAEPVYVLLLLLLAAADLWLALWLCRTQHRRALLAACVSFHVLLLLLFKYAPFFAPGLGYFGKLPPLPTGFSFFTFHAISYLVDVAHGDAPPQRSFLALGAYLLLFPRLIAGPILRYRQGAGALHTRRSSLDAAAAGIRRFAAGFAKKLLLADRMGALFTALLGIRPLPALGAWGALLAYAFQLYFDFSGYSDMAIGLGRILGFRFPENFRYPYTAASISDFWRRWHITLSAFFKSYVYIPLGGNRHGALRTGCNVAIVWILTGIWHGSTLNFLLWGLYYALLLILEKLLLARLPWRAPGFITHPLTLLAVLLGWLLFAFDGSTPARALGEIGPFVAALAGRNGLSDGLVRYELVRHLPLFLLCALGSTPLPRLLYCQTVYKKRLFWLRTALPLCALLLALTALADAGFQPFLYLRF